jgi:AcrR family transcriptional regulator
MNLTGLDRLPEGCATEKKLSKAGQKTADDILAAAEKLFAQKGFKGTTLKEVSEACGANTALISYYYGGKKGLRDAVFQKHIKRAGSGFDALYNREVESFDNESFKALISLFLEKGHEDATIFRLALWSMVDAGDLADRMAELMWQPFFDRLREIILHLTHYKLSPEEAELRVWALMATVQGFVQARWHTSNHVRVPSNKEIFFKNYRHLIIEDLVDSLLKA